MTGIGFGTNLDSLRAQRSLSSSSRSFAQTSERLSSGLRINRASDDAAGLALSADLDNSARVYAQGLLNVNDGISLLSVSQGALEELSNITTRQQELATEAANGTLSSVQRGALNLEAAALTQEYNRIISTAEFNQVALLDGTLSNFSLQGGFGVDGGIGVAVNAALSHGEYDGSAFADSAAFTNPGGVSNFTVGDVNGDGTDDFATSNGTHATVRSGDGTLLQTVLNTNGGIVRFADVNNDSKLDVISLQQGSGQVTVAIGNGNGTFKATSIVSPMVGENMTDMALGDFNGDGKMDIVEVGGFGGSDAVIYIRLGNGNGTFKTSNSNSIASATGSVSVMLSDINNDGREDVLLSTNAGGPYIGLGNASTTYIAFNPTLATTGSFLAVTDVTGDGKKDAIIGSAGYFKVLTGTGAGTFSASASIGVTGTAQAAGDFNGDGILDVLATSTTGGTIRLGNGDGTFKAAGVSFALAASNIQFVSAGDFNGDGQQDIIAMRTTLTTGQINYQTIGSALTTKAVQISLSTATAAKAAIDRLEAQLGRIDSEIGSIGGAQSRLFSAAQNLATLRENYQIASSNIKDADVATEVAELVRAQILQKAGAAVIAQANSAPQLMLKLLDDNSG